MDVSTLVSDRQDSLAAIHRLHIDVLYIIFELNIDDLSPLETARRTSQVCSLWRDLLIESPSIWGKVINLSELQLERDVSPWRDVVMERTGDAPLTISGGVPMCRAGWFLDFLSPYWEKVRHFDVYPIGFCPSVYDPIPDYLLKDSPRCLETFHFPRFRFNARAPWVANLRGITFGPPFREHDILQLLPTIPFLEYAKFQLWWTGHEATTVFLPHLECLVIKHFPEQVARLLSHIIPKKECTYNIYTYASTLHNWEGVLRGVQAKCLRRSFSQSSNNTLQLSVREESIDFRTLERAGTFSQFKHHHQVSGYPERTHHGHIPKFLTEYLVNPSPSIFAKVTSFVFYASQGIGLNDGPYQNQNLDMLKQLFSLFPVLSTLGLSQGSLRLLTTMYGGSEPESNILFPSLKNVQLDVFDAANCFDSELEHLLLRFLTQRQLCGKPIITLYIAAPIATTSNVDWTFLEFLHDLEVVWFRESTSMGPILYVCRDPEIFATYPTRL